MKINFKKTLGKLLPFVIIAVAVVVMGEVIFLFNQGGTHEFAGNIDRIEGGMIIATGFFSENAKPVPGNKDQKFSIEISVDSNTKLTRLAIKIPQGVTRFNIDDLEKKESPTDLETIKNDLLRGHVIGIEAVLKKDGSNRKFIGETLYFRVPLFNN